MVGKQTPDEHAAGLAHRRDRHWVIAIEAARLQALARREVAIARDQMRRTRRLLGGLRVIVGRREITPRRAKTLPLRLRLITR